jgi:hypothetical protein
VKKSSMRSGSFSFVWMDELEIRPEDIASDGDGTAIAVDFPIPYGVVQSRDRVRGLNEGIGWHLHVFARGAGGRYQADFVVPVFYTPESRPPTEDGLGGDDAPVARSASCAIEIESLPDRTIVRLPFSRAGVGWTVAPLLIAAPLGLASPWLGPLGFPWGWGVALTLLVAAAAGADLVSRPRIIEVEPGWLTVRAGLFGGRVQRRLPAAAISRVAFSMAGIEVTSPGDVATVARVRTRDQRWLAAELRRLIREAREDVRRT